MIIPWNISIQDGELNTSLEGELSVSGNLQGGILNNLNSFDFGERILELMSSPIFLNILCEDPGAGTLTDRSGNGHDGTYTGIWVSAQRLIYGRNWKLNHNGIDNYISLGDHNDFSFGDGSNDSTVTWFGIIEVTDSGGGLYQVIYSKWDETTGSELREWQVTLSSTENLCLFQFDESANVDVVKHVNTPLSVGWHTFIIASPGDGGAAAMDNVKIYIDGVEVASNSVNDGAYVAMENLTSPCWIGAREHTDGTPIDHMTGDSGCLGIDASEWDPAKVWRFHQLCLANYSEDGVNL